MVRLRHLSKILACMLFSAVILLSSSGVPGVKAASQTIQNDSFWKDTSGNPIYAQSGNIIKVGNTYYWYGVQYDVAVDYYNNPTGKHSVGKFMSINCYSSTDLVHWKFENNIIKAGAAGTTFDPVAWFGRMGVLYNSQTGKYVLLINYNNSSTGVKGVLFATSSTPTGAFTYDHIQTTVTNVYNNAVGDFSLFKDTDGSAYMIFSDAHGRQHAYVAPLGSDYLSIQPATQVGTFAQGQEANCMFKYNNLYYYCTSDTYGWNASHTYYMTSSNIFGTYSSCQVMSGTNNDFSHVTQVGSFLPLTGSSATTIMYLGDRWSDFGGNGLGYYVWEPLSFNGSSPVFNSFSQWNLDVSAGTWSVGSGNNYVLNPSFEADRVSQTTAAGWTMWTDLTGASPNNNASGGYTGNWAWKQTYTSAFQANTYQTITLPNGTYTLTAWVEGSGGESKCNLYARDYGESVIDKAINTAIGTWTKVTISGINVTNGSCTVGVMTVGSANQWVKFDDFSLVKS